MTRSKSLAVLALGGALAGAQAQAIVYKVTWDLGGLALPSSFDPSHLMYLDFQLTDGSTTGDGNSTVKLYGASMTGGFFHAPLPDFGNVVTYPNGVVRLQDGSGWDYAVADHALAFDVNSTTAQLTFEFSVSTSSYDSPVPDYFNISLLDNNLNQVPTQGLNDSEFVGYEITSDLATLPQTYAVDPSYAGIYSFFGDQRFVNLAAPNVTVAPAPGPAAAIPFIVGLWCFRRRL